MKPEYEYEQIHSDAIADALADCDTADAIEVTQIANNVLAQNDIPQATYYQLLEWAHTHGCFVTIKDGMMRVHIQE